MAGAPEDPGLVGAVVGGEKTWRICLHRCGVYASAPGEREHHTPSRGLLAPPERTVEVLMSALTGGPPEPRYLKAGPSLP